MNTVQLIAAFGGTNAVAELCNVRPPSVSGWKETGRIPDDKLIRLAPVAESRGIATRKELFPDDWRKIWPELAQSQAPTAQPAIEIVADAHAAIKQVEAVAVAAIRQEAGQATAEIKHVAEELLKDDDSWDGATDRRKADAPWDGKTERRKLDAPIDRRVSPASVARAEFLRARQQASSHGRMDIPGAGQGV